LLGLNSSTGWFDLAALDALWLAPIFIVLHGPQAHVNSCGHRPVHLARINTPVFANPAAGTAEQKIADLKAQVETHLELSTSLAFG
jgi:hypothetical protein